MNVWPGLQRVVAGTIAVTAAACLEPPTEKLGTSANLLPAGATVPDVIANTQLSEQIRTHDGVDDQALASANNMIVRGTGMAGGSSVRFWSFGAASRTPAALYRFGAMNQGSFQPNDHLPLVDALPGDFAYNPIHAIYQVVVTTRYQGERITTWDALADAIELGLVEPPVDTHSFVVAPIVQSGVQLEVGGTAGAIPPTKVYGMGYVVDMFQLGAVRPAPSPQIPTSQASVLRVSGAQGYDEDHPIFLATPAAQGYSPLSTVVDVDLAQNITADTIHSDADVLVRDPVTGAITGHTDKVTAHAITDVTRVLEVQLTDGMP